MEVKVTDTLDGARWHTIFMLLSLDSAEPYLPAMGLELPHDAANGVLLPRAIHDGLANDQTYMRAVFEELSKASTRQQGMDILRDIGEQLLNGTFPR